MLMILLAAACSFAAEYMNVKCALSRRRAKQAAQKWGKI